MNSSDFVVKFEAGKNGPITKVEGRVAFPERNGKQPQVGETWLVRKAGENKARTVTFLKQLCRAELFGVAVDDGAFLTGRRLMPVGLPETRADGWEYRPFAEVWPRNKTNNTYWTLANKLANGILLIVNIGSTFGTKPEFANGSADNELAKYRQKATEEVDRVAQKERRTANLKSWDASHDYWQEVAKIEAAGWDVRPAWLGDTPAWSLAPARDSFFRITVARDEPLPVFDDEAHMWDTWACKFNNREG